LTRQDAVLVVYPDLTVAIRNLGATPLAFNGYQILSEAGRLDPNGWMSIADRVTAGKAAEVMQVLGFGAISSGEMSASTQSLAEGNIAGKAILIPGAEFSLGKPFQGTYEEVISEISAIPGQGDGDLSAFIQVGIEGGSIDIAPAAAYVPVTYTLLEPPYRFRLEGNQLVLNDPLDYEMGDDYFTVRVRAEAQGMAPLEKSFVIEVENVNEAPTVYLRTPGLPLQVYAGRSLSLSPITASDPDIRNEEGDNKLLLLNISVAHGELAFGSVEMLTQSTGSADGRQWQLLGSIADLNTAIQTLKYVSEPSFVGEDTYQFQINDLGHTGLGPAITSSFSFPIEVLEPALRATEDILSALSTLPLVGQASLLLENDMFPIDRPPQVEIVEPPAIGSLELKSDGSFVYTAPWGASGFTTFKYRLVEGTAASASALVMIDLDPYWGDANGDFSVDLTDFGILKKSFGTSDRAGDLNNDGSVDLTDFSILKSTFGSTATPPLPAAPADGQLPIAAHNAAIDDVFRAIAVNEALRELEQTEE
jgi:hypothetical protein